MSKSLSRTQRRLGVLINYASLTMVLLCSYVGEFAEWSYIMIVCVVVSIALVVITLFRYHIRTGLWRLVHSKVDSLDERQIQVTHEALRYSYSIFTITCLAVLLWKSVFQGRDPNLIIIFAVLLYLAHTLPSSIIAWTEKEV